MNLRQSITRNITYSNVTVTTKEETINFIVYGETSPTKELKKLFKTHSHLISGEIPTITVEVKTEQRAISLEDFIKYSTIINNESEEK